MILLGELFAVKQLDLDNTSDDDKFRRKLLSYQKEIEVMKNLNHPNIVRYLGTQLCPNCMYIFLEYVPGGSISSLLAKFGKFEESVLKLYASQILHGLMYLHENSIIHRDIKVNITIPNLNSYIYAILNTI
jgi:serine/threonine protein kinase